MPDLEISTTEAWNIVEPVSRRSWSVVRLVTKDKIEGWGEARPLPRESIATLKSAVAGASAAAVEPMRVKMKGHLASAAVNAACLDICAKAAKAPLYQFLGGPTRNKARAFCSLTGDSDSALLDAMARARDAGFRAFGVPPPPVSTRNQGKAFVEATQKRMNALRQAGGENVDFVLQAEGGIRAGDAASLATVFERFHLLWFDEPCDTKSLGALRKIADENVTPIGFGAGLTDAGQFQNLLRDDAVDILRPEIATHGITGIRKIAALGEVYYVATAPRHSQGPITTAAALHLAASLPNFFIQHIPFPAAPQDREMRAAIAGTVETVNNGYAELPTRPGLGIQVNRDVLKKYGEQIA